MINELLISSIGFGFGYVSVSFLGFVPCLLLPNLFTLYHKRYLVATETVLRNQL